MVLEIDHFLQIHTLGSSRLGLVQRIHQSQQVLAQGFRRERGTTDGALHDTVLVGAVLHLTGLGILHCTGHIGGYRADFRIGHQTARAEDLTQLADQTHRIRAGDQHVEIQITTLDGFSQIVEANNVRTGSLGFFSLRTLCEYRHTHRLAVPLGSTTEPRTN